MTMLYSKVVEIDQKKPVILDTSYLISNESPFVYSGRMFVPEGVIGELYKLARDYGKSEEVRKIANQRFEEVTEKVKNGEIFLFRSIERKKGKNKKKENISNETREILSQVDKKVITCAEQFPQGAQILSCDHALCNEARCRGIVAHSIATLPQPNNVA